MIDINLLMAEGCSSTSIAATLEGFECANVLHAQYSKDSALPFRVTTLSHDGQSVRCSGGLTLSAQRSLAEAPLAQILILPGFLFHILSMLPKITPTLPWIRSQHAQGVTVASMCTGAFIAAEAGILDNKIATTHWYFADAFRARYPNVKLQENHIVTDDRGTLCSGGASAGNDMLLHLIRKFGSAELAAECSKKLLIDSARMDQTPYVSQRIHTNHEDQKIWEVQHWLDHHYASHIFFDQTASQFGFGPRNFIRRFKAATQQTPVQYLQALRIEKAKYLLETTQQTIDKITLDVGYEDGSSFRRLFKERVGISPGAYRKKFRILAEQ